jgi:hypothetical protein
MIRRFFQPRLRRFAEAVVNADGHEARCVCRLNSVERILEDKRVSRLRAHRAGGKQENIRPLFAAGRIIGREDRGEKPVYPRAPQSRLGAFPSGDGGDAERYAALFKFF